MTKGNDETRSHHSPNHPPRNLLRFAAAGRLRPRPSANRIRSGSSRSRPLRSHPCTGRWTASIFEHHEEVLLFPVGFRYRRPDGSFFGRQLRKRVGGDFKAVSASEPNLLRPVQQQPLPGFQIAAIIDHATAVHTAPHLPPSACLPLSRNSCMYLFDTTPPSSRIDNQYQA